jgi:hypothetical protein
VIIDTAHRRLLSIGLAFAAFVALVGCGSPTNPTNAAPTTGSASGPETTSVGFTTGGDKCTLGTVASTFTVGVPVRAVLTMTPALPTGGTVKVTVTKDGIEVVGARQEITMAEPAPCIYGTLQDLEVGHYRLSYAISPSSMPPATGEFDVTP